MIVKIELFLDAGGEGRNLFSTYFRDNCDYHFDIPIIEKGLEIEGFKFSLIARPISTETIEGERE